LEFSDSTAATRLEERLGGGGRLAGALGRKGVMEGRKRRVVVSEVKLGKNRESVPGIGRFTEETGWKSLL